MIVAVERFHPNFLKSFSPQIKCSIGKHSFPKGSTTQTGRTNEKTKWHWAKQHIHRYSWNSVQQRKKPALYINTFILHIRKHIQRSQNQKQRSTTHISCSACFTKPQCFSILSHKALYPTNEGLYGFNTIVFVFRSHSLMPQMSLFQIPQKFPHVFFFLQLLETFLTLSPCLNQILLSLNSRISLLRCLLHFPETSSYIDS